MGITEVKCAEEGLLAENTGERGEDLKDLQPVHTVGLLLRTTLQIIQRRQQPGKQEEN